MTKKETTTRLRGLKTKTKLLPPNHCTASCPKTKIRNAGSETARTNTVDKRQIKDKRDMTGKEKPKKRAKETRQKQKPRHEIKAKT
jgi:hypothetical protein